MSRGRGRRRYINIRLFSCPKYVSIKGSLCGPPLIQQMPHFKILATAMQSHWAQGSGRRLIQRCIHFPHSLRLAVRVGVIRKCEASSHHHLSMRLFSFQLLSVALPHTANLDGLDSKVTVFTLGLFHEHQENEGQPWQFGSNHCNHCVHREP